jgi:hypothetical protein
MKKKRSSAITRFTTGPSPSPSLSPPCSYSGGGNHSTPRSMQLVSIVAEEEVEEEEEGDNFIRNGEHTDSSSFDDNDHEREREKEREKERSKQQHTKQKKSSQEERSARQAGEKLPGGMT